MVDIQWSSSNKQYGRIENATNTRNVTNYRSNLIGWVLPTKKINTNQGKYNLHIPALANSRFELVPVINSPTEQAYNGTGKFSELEVGKPVIVQFLSGKNKPVIIGSYHYDDDNIYQRDANNGKSFAYPGNKLSQVFDTDIDIRKLSLESKNLYQPEGSPANNIIQGGYDAYTTDGQHIEFSPNSSLLYLPEEYKFTEGLRFSTFERTLKSADTQKRKLPYEISRRLDRVYNIVNGEFIPKEVREKDIYGTPLGEITDYLFSFFDPILRKIENLNSFILGIEEFYEAQVEWFENNILQPGKELFELWKTVISEGDIRSLFGLEELSININVGQLLDNLIFSNFQVNSSIPLLNAIFGIGQWIAKQAILRGIKDLFNTLDIPTSFDLNLGSLGTVFSIGLGGLGGGSSDPTRYLPSKGSVISIDPPRIFSEGSAIYETLKFGNNIQNTVTQKAREIGFITTDINTLIREIVIHGSSEGFYQSDIRRDKASNLSIDSSLLNFNTTEINLYNSNNIKDTELRINEGAISEVNAIPIVDTSVSRNDFSMLTSGEAGIFSNNNIYRYDNPQESIAIFSLFDTESRREGVTGGVMLNAPSVINHDNFIVTAQVSFDQNREIILELLDESGETVINSTVMQKKSDYAEYDTYLGAIDFNNSDNNFRYRVKADSIIYPSLPIKRPPKGEVASSDFRIILDSIEETEEGYLLTASSYYDSGSNLKSLKLKVFKDQEIVATREVDTGETNITFNIPSSKERTVSFSIQATNFQSGLTKISNTVTSEGNSLGDMQEVSPDNYADLNINSFKYFFDNSIDRYTFFIKLNSSIPSEDAYIVIEVETEEETLRTSKLTRSSFNGTISSVISPPLSFSEQLIDSETYRARIGVNLGEGIIYSEYFDLLVDPKEENIIEELNRENNSTQPIKPFSI